MPAKNETKNDTVTKDANVTEVIKGPAPSTTSMVSAPKPAILNKDPNQIDTDIGTKMQALMGLLDDGDIPGPMREKLRMIVDQARPDKPGMEEMDTTWALARLSIAQPTSQASSKPDNAKAGDIFTSGGQIVERPFGFIPVFFHYENIMFKQGEKAPECYSPDAKVGSPYGTCLACPNLPFGLQNGGRGDQKPTECQNNIVVVAVAFDMSQVVKIQFGKTSRGAGSALLSLAKANPFPWKQSYLLETEKRTGEFTYWVYKTSPTGKDNDAAQIKIAKALNELFTASRQKALFDFYSRAAQAPAMAAAAEGAFQGGKLDAALGEGMEPDLSTPPPPASGSARTAAKPM